MKAFVFISLILTSVLATATALKVEFERYDVLQRSDELYRTSEFRCNGFTVNNVTSYLLLRTQNGTGLGGTAELRGVDSSDPNFLNVVYFQEFMNEKDYDTNEGETVYEGASSTMMPFAGSYKLKINKVADVNLKNLWSGTLEIQSANPKVNQNKGTGIQTVTCTSHR